jgi:DNA-binding transcriptional LysR family regulator
VELRQLQYFVAVARHGTFTRAAEELWITQSALSQQVRRLEEELGVRLLHRTSRGAEPTPAGADLLVRAEAVLAELDRARADLERHTGLTRGRARVAAGPADAVRLPAALAAFHRAHPGLQVALRHAGGGEMAGLVQRGAVDVAVAGAGAAASAEGVEAFPLPPEELRLLLPPGDPLAARGPVPLADLRERPLVLAEPGSALRAAVLEACKAAGFSPVPLFEVSDPASVRFLVHSGLGASVVPASWACSRSTSTCTIRRSSRSAASSARTGAMTRQGGHQAAVKSTSTGSSDSSTSAAKWASSTAGRTEVGMPPACGGRRRGPSHIPHGRQ